MLLSSLSCYNNLSVFQCLYSDTVTVNLPKLSTKLILWYHTLRKPCYGYVNGYQLQIRGGADQSLAQPTSRCRRKESIVSLERGICSCTELQVFSCYRGWMKACQATRAISTTSRSELSSSFFFLQGKAPLRRLLIKFTAKSIAGQLGISRERVGSFVHEDLDMRKLSARWVPKCLKADQKRQRCQSSEQYLEFFRREPNDFM